MKDFFPCFAALVAALHFCAQPSAADKPPNIVFILADDLGIGEVGVYPSNSTHGRLATPNLDKLASESMLFTDAYSGEAVCAPSRCTLMTGRHTGHTTIRGNYKYQGHDLPLAANDTTVAQVLKAAGYRTALVGKWGLGWINTTGSPLAKGFDTFVGQLDQAFCHNYYPGVSDNMGVWFNDTLNLYSQNDNASRARCMMPGNSCTHTNVVFRDNAIDYLEGYAEAGWDEPFFLYLAFTVPHAGGWSGILESGAPVPSDGQYANETGWPEVECDHAAAVTGLLDDAIGRVLDVLDVLGLAEDTAVFFSSDNGAHDEGGHSYKFFDSSGPFRGFKRSLYEGGIRTPAMVRWPGVVAAGSTSNFSWYFPDFLPTAADIAGAPASGLPADLDGQSILPTLKGQLQAEHEYMYWEFCTHSKWGHAVRAGDWKGVSFSVDEPLELYDLVADPGEASNVADQHPDVVAQLGAYAKAAHVDSPYFPVRPCHTSWDESDR